MTKDELLQLTNDGEDILLNIFKLMGLEFKGFGQKHLNPFYSDTKPALIFTKKDGTILFKDFGDADYSGDIFEFAKFYYGRRLPDEFHLLVSDISADLNISVAGSKNIAPRPRKARIAADKTELMFEPAIYNSEGKRLFHIAINHRIVNKNEKGANLATDFVNVEITKNDFIEHVKQGFAFSPAILLNGYRNEQSWQGADIIAVDVDNKTRDNKRKTADYMGFKEAFTKELSKFLIFGYTTHSSTPDWERYRLVFALPGIIRDKQQLKILIRKVIKIYGSDEATKSVANLFFGNNLNVQVIEGTYDV